MTVSVWQLYVAFGIVLLIIEPFIPGIFFFPAGMMCLLTAILSVLVDSIAIQLSFLAMSTIIAAYFFQKIFKKWQMKHTVRMNTDAMTGAEAIVLEEANENELAWIKLYGDTWRAISLDSHVVLRKGQKVRIVKLDGNKVIVSPVPTEGK